MGIDLGSLDFSIKPRLERSALQQIDNEILRWKQRHESTPLKIGVQFNQQGQNTGPASTGAQTGAAHLQLNKLRIIPDFADFERQWTQFASKERTLKVRLDFTNGPGGGGLPGLPGQGGGHGGGGGGGGGHGAGHTSIVGSLLTAPNWHRNLHSLSGAFGAGGMAAAGAGVALAGAFALYSTRHYREQREMAEEVGQAQRFGTLGDQLGAYERQYQQYADHAPGLSLATLGGLSPFTRTQTGRFLSANFGYKNPYDMVDQFAEGSKQIREASEHETLASRLAGAGYAVNVAKGGLQGQYAAEDARFNAATDARMKEEENALKNSSGSPEEVARIRSSYKAITRNQQIEHQVYRDRITQGEVRFRSRTNSEAYATAYEANGLPQFALDARYQSSLKNDVEEVRLKWGDNAAAAERNRITTQYKADLKRLNFNMAQFTQGATSEARSTLLEAGGNTPGSLAERRDFGLKFDVQAAQMQYGTDAANAVRQRVNADYATKVLGVYRQRTQAALGLTTDVVTSGLDANYQSYQAAGIATAGEGLMGITGEYDSGAYGTARRKQMAQVASNRLAGQIKRLELRNRPGFSEGVGMEESAFKFGDLNPENSLDNIGAALKSDAAAQAAFDAYDGSIAGQKKLNETLGGLGLDTKAYPTAMGIGGPDKESAALLQQILSLLNQAIRGK